MGIRLGKAFLFGGCVSVIGQLFVMVAAMIVPDAMLAVIVAMFAFGIASAILIVTGVYDKCARFADFGADQPLSGLMYGAAMNNALARAQGVPAGRAFLKGFAIVIAVVGTGFVVSALLGAIIG